MPHTIDQRWITGGSRISHPWQSFGITDKIESQFGVSVVLREVY